MLQYKLEDCGNAVKIGDTMIPAMCIQVENVPGFIEDQRGGANWYGVYFEIAFEDGSLWEVAQGSTPEDWNNPRVEAVITENWGNCIDPAERKETEMGWASWKEFLDSYKVASRVT